MNDKKAAKTAMATTANTIKTTTAQKMQTQSNERRLRPSQKSIDGAKDKKLVKTQSTPANKDRMVQKKTEKPLEQAKKTEIVRHDDKKKTEKRSNVTVRIPVQSSVNRAIITNEAKKVPKLNGNVLKEPIAPKTVRKKVSTKEETTKQNKTDTKPSSKTRAAGPFRASHSIDTKPTISPHNVMKQVHNVTVSSPPLIRRDLKQADDGKTSRADKVEGVVTRDRMRTRTLEKSEVILLKPIDENTTRAMEAPNLMSIETSNVSSPLHQNKKEIKQPVSFEIAFDDKNHKQINKLAPEMPDEDATESYDDDFESYESDFEDDLSSSEANKLEQSAESERISSSSSDRDTLASDSEIYDDASNTKHPFNVIDMNQELDSGSFEMRPMPPAQISHNEHYHENMQRSRQVDMQNDSGIELLPGTSTQLTSGDSCSGGPSSSLDINNSLDFSTINSSTKQKSVQSDTILRQKRRGAELLKKITLDKMNYVLYDCQPIPYDLFMQIYGTNNTVQVSIQTHNTRIDQDTQSEPAESAEAWTQHPPTFYSCHMNTNGNFSEYRNGCGAPARHPKATEASLSDGVKLLQGYTMPSRVNVNEAHFLEISYDQLNRFLLANEITIARLINGENDSQANVFNSVIPDSLGYFAIHLEMDDFEILQIFASPTLPGFLFTLHHEIKGQLYLIAVWDLASAKKPICLLSAWTAVLCIEMHASARDLVFAGADDGSIFVWDYCEAKYWHPSISNKDETVKQFVPSQVVKPVVDISSFHDDIGQVVAIRSICASIDVELLNGYNLKQICSLHETGLLVLWSILETSAKNLYVESTDNRIDHQSEWSNVKLVQYKSVDLRPNALFSTHFCSLQSTSPSSMSFNKTRSYFENDLFDDTALQELQDPKNEINKKYFTNFRCIALELTRDGILIATNENYILFGRKTMRSETFQKFLIDTHPNGRIDALLALSLFEEDVVLAALHDGSIKSFCYDSRAHKSVPLHGGDFGEEPSISSVYSLPPMPPASGGQVSASSSISAASTGALMVGHDMGKSCTIQSIVQCERKLYDEVQALNNLDMNEYKTLDDDNHEEDPDRIASNSTHFVNDQIIIRNSLDHSARRRRQIVQLMRTNRLAMLHNGSLRLFGFRNKEFCEINAHYETTKLVEAATTIGSNDVEYLILLNENGETQVHVCTKNKNESA